VQPSPVLSLPKKRVGLFAKCGVRGGVAERGFAEDTVELWTRIQRCVHGAAVDVCSTHVLVYVLLGKVVQCKYLGDYCG